jgi:predicted DNA-binding protein
MGVIKKESITIRVTPRFKQKLEKIAINKGHSISDFIRYELEKIVEKEEDERNTE